MLSVRSIGIKTDLDGESEVTAQQCVEASLRKCTSEVINGHWRHEVVGLVSSIVMDMMPFETRLFRTANHQYDD